MLRPYDSCRPALLLNRPVLVVDQLVHGILTAPRAPPFLAGMVGNRDSDHSDVVGIIQLLQSVTQSGRRIQEATWVGPGWRIGWVHLDPNDVVTRRDDGLSIGAVQHEVLPPQPLHVRIAVVDADSLISGDLWEPQGGNRWPAAGAIVPGLDAADVCVVGRDVDHAEATFSGLPGLRAIRRQERIRRVIAKVV